MPGAGPVRGGTGSTPRSGDEGVRVAAATAAPVDPDRAARAPPSPAGRARAERADGAEWRMADRHEDLRDRLAAIAEELGDRALGRLRDALDEGGAPDPAAVAEERLLTRARRSVEKAVHLLDGAPADGGP